LLELVALAIGAGPSSAFSEVDGRHGARSVARW
jgi:hypothetical protein